MDSLYLANSNARAVIALEALLRRPDVQGLMEVLNTDGEEARLIGGAVRDSLMGRAVGDIDVATTALPALVMERVTSMGWKAVPTGLEHGTVTVVIKGVPFEVTTLRRDEDTDGRHATVAFTRDFAEDAGRRDFTINAMSVSSDGTIHDYSTGRDDARAGTIRFMGDPASRIREDYLRILRFFRFHASHGHGEPEPAALAACASERQGLTQLSRERIRQEIVKLLMAHGAVGIVDVMQKIGIWDVLFPGFSFSGSRLERLVALEPIFAGHASSPVLRLAVLFAAPAEKDSLASLLRLSRREEAQLKDIRSLAPSFDVANPETVSFARAYLAAGADTAMDALLVMLASKNATAVQAAQWQAVAAQLVARKPVMPFRNIAFDKFGIPAGPARGALVRTATDQWIRAGLPADKPSQKAILAAVIASQTQR